jgi:hypothetical protein
MITTNTGAKKIEGTDNWREIFDAHNDSVDAHDTAAQSLAPIVKGKQCAVSVASGKYVLLMGSTITGKADGAYKATKAIPANTDIDGTYLTAATDGFANSLSDHIGKVYNASGNGISARFVKQEGFVYCCFSGYASSNLTPYANVITLPNDCHTTENIKPAGNAGAQKLYVSSTNQTLMVDSEQISSGTSVKGFIIYPTVSLS